MGTIGINFLVVNESLLNLARKSSNSAIVTRSEENC